MEKGAFQHPQLSRNFHAVSFKNLFNGLFHFIVIRHKTQLIPYRMMFPFLRLQQLCHHHIIRFLDDDSV